MICAAGGAVMMVGAASPSSPRSRRSKGSSSSLSPGTPSHRRRRAGISSRRWSKVPSRTHRRTRRTHPRPPPLVASPTACCCCYCFASLAHLLLPQMLVLPLSMTVLPFSRRDSSLCQTHPAVLLLSDREHGPSSCCETVVLLLVDDAPGSTTIPLRRGGRR